MTSRAFRYDGTKSFTMTSHSQRYTSPRAMVVMIVPTIKIPLAT